MSSVLQSAHGFMAQVTGHMYLNKMDILLPLPDVNNPDINGL